ncbi:kynureninase/PvdN C-terminal domain-containing protein [Bosea sp. PAMC 26642]|uniref:kynureninase/PvdN C-terminal domain-containing protein n=1 Tax=Bosea sp. (strain PAMC 26642) TaxID=1792307 RepID=UPI0007700835|nr:aminotransferase V [Bosea sp. PAMC 26642]AMJ61107.1 aminotransferase V [Bosea sp. PAMC 26642]
MSLAGQSANGTGPRDLRAHFTHFLRSDPRRLHFAAHSHHCWPDVTREAQLAAWDDAARLIDDKWSEVLGPVWSEVSAGIARHLHLCDPTTLVSAGNTHEFLLRLLSACPPDRPVRILSTDGEFHSFRRQIARLAEDGLVEHTAIAPEPFETLGDRLIAAAKSGDFDLAFVSQVLFGSGFALLDLVGLVDGLSAPGRLVVIDGYHGYLARPTDLSAVADRAFYVAGGYKYAMAGEGACFMHCPPGFAPRPRNTGWYAGFSALSAAPGTVAYAEDGSRFMGATFDPSGLYRMRASLRWLDEQSLDAAAVHAHSVALQERFAAGLEKQRVGPLSPDRLVVPIAEEARGNFLTFEHPDAQGWYRRLHEAGIVTDVRGMRLRVGFGLYHAAEDVDALLARLRECAP